MHWGLPQNSEPVTLKLCKGEQNSNVFKLKDFEMQDTFLMSSLLLHNTTFKPYVVHRV